MGYASGQNYRNETIGYGHETICSEPGCVEEIDKGLYFTCGGMEGVNGERGCGRHFCGSHLSYLIKETDDPEQEDRRENAALCPHCLTRAENGLPTGMEDVSWVAPAPEGSE